MEGRGEVKNGEERRGEELGDSEVSRGWVTRCSVDGGFSWSWSCSLWWDRRVSLFSVRTDVVGEDGEGHVEELERRR